MEIDEEKEIIDYSDHNLITVVLRMEQKKRSLTIRKGNGGSVSTMKKKER